MNALHMVSGPQLQFSRKPTEREWRGFLPRIRVLSWDFTFRWEVWKWGWGGLNECERPVYFHAGEAHWEWPTEGRENSKPRTVPWGHACLALVSPGLCKPPRALHSSLRAAGLKESLFAAPNHHSVCPLLSCWGWERARRDGSSNSYLLPS